MGELQASSGKVIPGTPHVFIRSFFGNWMKPGSTVDRSGVRLWDVKSHGRAGSAESPARGMAQVIDSLSLTLCQIGHGSSHWECQPNVRRRLLLPHRVISDGFTWTSSA